MKKAKWSVEVPVHDVEDQEQRLEEAKREARNLLAKIFLDGGLGHGECTHVSGAIDAAADVEEVSDVVEGYLAPYLDTEQEQSLDADTSRD